MPGVVVRPEIAFIHGLIFALVTLVLQLLVLHPDVRSQLDLVVRGEVALVTNVDFGLVPGSLVRGQVPYRKKIIL